MKNNRYSTGMFTACLFALLVVIYYALRSSLFAFDMNKAQLMVYPFLLLLLLSVRIIRKKIPLLVLGIAVVGTLSGVKYSYSYGSGARPGVLLARFEGDDFEIDTRIFRERLSAQLLPKLHLRVGRYYKSIKSHKAVDKNFVDGENIKVVLWGDKQWLNVSFPVEAYIPSEEKKETIQAQRLLKFRPVEYVPVFGISVKPEGATLRFLAALLSGLAYGDPFTGAGDEASRAMQESYLRSAARMKSAWSSFAHRAYPFWIVGNQHLRAALADEGYESGELNCALEAYGEALGLIRFLDNPELRAAVYNNKAIALALKFYFERE
ncbi:hypothetical protein OAO01_09370, partial [Oligoflexia bacterium]|nr:hypothetical protein [Oligoflexia bacterium]